MLQAALLAAKTASAAFGALGLIVAAAVIVAVPVVAPAIVVSAVSVGTTRVSRRPEVASRTRLAWTVLGDIQAQRTAGDLSSVDLLDGLGGVLFGCESNEREPSGPTGFAIFRDVNIYDFAYFSKELA